MGYSKSQTQKAIKRRQRYNGKKDEINNQRRENYKKNPEKYRAYERGHYHKNQNQILANLRDRWKNDSKFKLRKQAANKKQRSTREFKDKRNLREKKLREYWRDELINVLEGYICKKCGYKISKIPLQIDHIKGKGRRERRKNSDTSRYYKKYALEPERARRELQVLCANCNQIKKFENKEI
jgi:hypothetical protein